MVVARKKTSSTTCNDL